MFCLCVFVYFFTLLTWKWFIWLRIPICTVYIDLKFILTTHASSNWYLQSVKRQVESGAFPGCSISSSHENHIAHDHILLRTYEMKWYACAATRLYWPQLETAWTVGLGSLNVWKWTCREKKIAAICVHFLLQIKRICDWIARDYAQM